MQAKYLPAVGFFLDFSEFFEQRLKWTPGKISRKNLLRIPNIVKGKLGTQEDVSVLNGLAIPAILEALTTIPK
jgi:hypothetical protein